MRRFAIHLAATLIVLLAGGPAARAGPASRSPSPPNIVLILVDDLGWRDTGFMGSDFHQTPNIDRLAAGGLVFTDAYANCANCAPSRAAIMSGQYAPRTGIYTVGSPDRGHARNRQVLTVPNRRRLDPAVTTLAEVLRGAGYATAMVGKWHLGSDPADGPEAHGFDLNVGGNLSGHPKSYYSPYRNVDLPDGAPGTHLTNRLTDEAIAFVRAHREQPFFLYYSTYAVHTPIQPDKAVLKGVRDRRRGERHKSPKYAALVETVDANVGRLLGALDDLDLADDTIVVFTSDNGGNGAHTTMAPLRGSKGMFYEGGVRVPLAVRWPGRIAPGTRSRLPVIGMDLYPTLVEAAGASLPEGQAIDGVSLLPHLRGGGPPEREAIFWHFPAYLEAAPGLEVGHWRTTPCSAVRRGDHKLIEFFEDGHRELYDLARDPGEKYDLAATQPDLAASMHETLAGWREAIDAPLPTERNPLYVSPASAAAPNIIYILADDLGYNELGCYGQRKIRTPNIDRLAREGMRFTQHYSGSPVCAPSRCALMTGLHTGHAFIRNNRGRPVAGQYPIPENTVTVARLLGDLGYTTGCIGKWGLGGPGTTGVPWQQGFDHFYGYLDQWRAHNFYPTYLYRNATQVPLDNPDFPAHQKLETAPDDPAAYDRYQGNDYAPDLMIEEALDFVRRHRGERFFLAFTTTVPHVAIQVPDEALEGYPESWDETPYLGQRGYLPHRRPRAAYAAMISRMDEHVGRLVALVDELGLARETLIVFTSDNGPTFAGGVDWKFFESAGPLRGLKQSVHEGGIRVPFIARWPGRIAPGSVSEHVSAFWDMLPTFVELAGGVAPGGLDGLSMKAELLGRPADQPKHASLYWELGRQQALRAGDLKLVRVTDKEGRTDAMLFDLAADPGEQRNLAGDDPETLSRMVDLIRAARSPSTVFTSVYDDGR